MPFSVSTVTYTPWYREPCLNCTSRTCQKQQPHATLYPRTSWSCVSSTCRSPIPGLGNAPRQQRPCCVPWCQHTTHKQNAHCISVMELIIGSGITPDITHRQIQATVTSGPLSQPPWHSSTCHAKTQLRYQSNQRYLHPAWCSLSLWRVWHRVLCCILYAGLSN